MGNLFVTIKCAGPGCIRGPVEVEPPPLGAKLVCVVCGHKTTYTGGHARIVIGSDRYAAKFSNVSHGGDTVDDLYRSKTDV